MIQLLGGLAVAGVVAAGGAAFTASGVESTVATPSALIGGAVTHNVVGAVMSGITYDVAGTYKEQVTGFHVSLADGNATAIPANATVAVVVTGNATNASGATATCTRNSAPTTTWDCAPTSGYYTAISQLSVSVTPA
ncbi:hypothetical protein [Actinoplanes sp. DH11]|uniref:hypothetical protein n=1 Tax=Actinoplanes sp. DH11 TaxID=2857011 RepID=UPI001E3A5DFF|nr:hypothetical protein [Actinoplanes sp. DH11]